MIARPVDPAGNFLGRKTDMKEITARLLAWYDRHARKLPWRGSADPYQIWVSEIMLQQTRTETVAGYYARFLEAFPTVQDLAAAEESAVLKQWEGLGYYARARNLQAGAKQVMTEFGGKVPSGVEDLLKIRGIGPYTAGAIASIAWNLPVPAVDGNVIRVISRLYAIGESLGEPGTRTRIETLAKELVPESRPGDYNQAVMDLGATVCVPGTPDCDRCPLEDLCRGRRTGAAAELPKIPGAKPPKEMLYDLILIYDGKRVLARKRTEKMLSGLWCFPLMKGWESAEARKAELRRRWGMEMKTFRAVGTAKHVFTHQVWQMTLYEGELREPAQAPEGYAWIDGEELETLAWPVAMKMALIPVRRRLSDGQ
ncbi:MAG: A/G-specific adenine glycosylase [Clostridia bacterium]|nr:A/G-specific adenine glycosylase [Clostridia bacterium]